MVFIVDGQRIATENFLVGQLYKIIYKNDNIVYAMCEGIGHDFVMFISDNPRIITLNIETAQTIDSIMPAEAGSMYDYNDLINKPTINNIALIGNLTSSELGLQTTLNTAQMAAVNSGIDSTQVEQIATNTTAIGNKQDVIDSTHKLSADLVDDSSTTNKFATAAQLSQISTNENNISTVETTVDAVIETKYGVNKFNPNWLVRTNYYYDFTDGVTHVTSASVLTPDFIELPANCTDIYIMSTDSTTGTCGLYFWNGETYIRFNSYTLAAIYNTSLHITLPSGTTRIKFWCNDKNMTGTQICMDYEPIAQFEEYTEKTVIKESALPDIGSPLKGKTIVNFGDSIFGNFRPPYDISTVIANLTGATVVNSGFGGCRMSQHNMATYDKFCMYRLAYSIANNDWTLQDAAIADPEWSDKPAYFSSSLNKLKTIDFSTVDVITIAYGTNDFMSDVRLDNENDAYDITRYKGALRYSIEQILGAFPNVRIIVCTPIYRSWNRDGSFYEDSNTKTDSYYKTLIDFGTACKEVCQEYNLQCIDNYYIGMGRYNRDYYWTSPDYTHPNINGRKIIGSHMANELY